MSDTAADAHLYLGCHMSEPELSPLAEGEAAVLCRPAPDFDRPNEDAAALVATTSGAGVLAVADGAGGAPAGSRAAQLALEDLTRTVTRCVDGQTNSTNLREAVMDGFERAHASITALGVGAATTLAVVTVDAGRLQVFHTGDSAVVVVGQRGRIKLQTVSHSPVGYALEAGYLDERQALHHDERHLVSNLLGCADMSVEVSSPLPLAPRDTVLLASDGLFDNLYIEEIVQVVRKGALVEAAADLAAQSLARMSAEASGAPRKPDDLAIVLYRPSAGRSRA